MIIHKLHLSFDKDFFNSEKPTVANTEKLADRDDGGNDSGFCDMDGAAK